jgi:PKD repeat protein
VLLTALVAAAAFVAFPGLSDADPTGLPTVTTGAATLLTNAGATLNGTVNPNDSDPGDTYSYTFTWSTQSDLSVVTGSDGDTVNTGPDDQPLSLPVTGLSAGTTYYFQLCATNGEGQACGAIQSFTTDDVPGVTTGGASSIGQTTATLNGTVDANDPDDGGTFAFSWGTTSGGPYNLGPLGASFNAGTSPGPVSASISGLTADTTYFFQLCATNDWGTTCDGEQTFTTAVLPPTVTTGAATVTTNGATLAGSVNPNDAAVSRVFFNYGQTLPYTSSTNATPSSLPKGKTAQSVAGTLSGLQSGTMFHYQLCATNSSGTSCGDDKTFTTNTPPTAVLSADTTSGPVPLKVTFDGSASSDPGGGSIASWSLDFGDGSSTGVVSGPVSSAITHTYTSPCSPCTATLTVTDNQGAQDTDTQTIHANPNQPPVASLTASTTSGTMPVAVTFDGSGSFDPDNIPLKSWSLDFGDGASQSGGPGPVSDDITHTYMTAGKYTAVLTVTDSSNATATKSVTITVNALPKISIGDVSQNEGNSGITNFVFSVGLTAPSTHAILVDYATADGTATAGSDYNAASGTLKIPAGTSCPGDPSCQITVQVNGDTLYEANETFTVNLTNPQGATIADGSATGTILNDDTAPLLMIQSAAGQEGNTGSLVNGSQTWSANGNLTLADASGFPNTAGAHTFFTSTPGQAGVTQYTYQGVSGNTLTGVSPGGSVSSGQWAFQPRTITLTVLLCDPQKTPPSATDPSLCVPIASGLDTKVQFSTSNGFCSDTRPPACSVVEGQDYVASSGTLDIPAGAESGPISVQNIPNTTPENPSNPTEDLTRWFFVNLSNPTNATIRWGTGTADIIEDDGLNPPAATTGAASGIGADHATVSATVNPNGETTNVFVQYGPTDAYGSQTATQVVAAGFANEPLSFPLSGLSPGTTYRYQVVASHADGISAFGDQGTFTTDQPPVAVLKADKTTGPHPLKVTFDGSASSDPDGSISSWSLAFGDGNSTGGSGAVPGAIAHTYASKCSCTASLTVTDNQGAESAAATVPINVSDAGPVPVLSGARAKATPGKSAKATVSVDPKGAASTVWVEYGTGPSYGQKSPSQTVPAGAAKTLTFTLKALTPRTLYHYRVVASHSDSGQASTTDSTFSTPKVKPMSVGLKRRTVSAAAGGMVPLAFTCKGNALSRCTVQIVLQLGKKRAGSKSFTLVPTQRKTVRVKLTRAAFRRLGDGSLHLVVNASVRSGVSDAGLQTMPITVLP